MEPIIEALNKKGSYNVIIKGDKEEIIKINHVRGVLASNKGKVAEEVSTADIIASCVGNNALPHIIPLIARGLIKRYEENNDLPLDLIRKLGPEDRLAGAIKMGLVHNMNVDKILYALASSFYFRAADESGDMFDRDIEFVEKYFKNGIEYILINVCGFSRDNHRNIIRKCEKYSEEIKVLYKIKG